jgi:hypothetical protein
MTQPHDLIIALLLGASVIQGLFFALASFFRPGSFSSRLVLAWPSFSQWWRVSGGGPSGQLILSLAFETGFSSKVAFNSPQ